MWPEKHSIVLSFNCDFKSESKPNIWLHSSEKINWTLNRPSILITLAVSDSVLLRKLLARMISFYLMKHYQLNICCNPAKDSSTNRFHCRVERVQLPPNHQTWVVEIADSQEWANAKIKMNFGSVPNRCMQAFIDSGDRSYRQTAAGWVQTRCHGSDTYVDSFPFRLDSPRLRLQRGRLITSCADLHASTSVQLIQSSCYRPVISFISCCEW